MRPYLTLALTIVLTSLVLLSARSAAADIGAKEQDLREKTAVEIGRFVTWCVENGAPDAGRAAVAEMLALAPTVPGFDAPDALFDDVESAADEATLAKALRVYGPKIGKALDKLAALKHEPDDLDRFDAYRFDALRWDRSSGRAKKLATWVKQEDDEGRRARLLARARAAAGDESAPLDALAVSLAKDEPLLLGSATHPLVGWLWLPKGWKKGRSYPVLIGVDGAGSNHKGYGAASATARGSRDVIVLAPVTLSNTNALAKDKYPHYDQALLDEWSPKRMEFDGPGVEALLAEIRALFGGEDRVFVTGFSGGGQYTYYKLLQDPDGVAGAVPCCANFGGHGKQDAPGAGESGGPPVRLLTGENDKHRDFTHGNKDSPGIEPQTDHAEQTLRDLGYTRVERRMVKAGHSPLHDLVWEFVDEVLEAR